MTYAENQLFIKAKEIFEIKVKEIQKLGIEKVERTAKIPFDKVDYKLLNLLNHVVRDHVARVPPTCMRDIAQCLQAFQHSYKELKFVEKPKSPWIDNIKMKIVKCKRSTRFHRELRQRKSSLQKKGKSFRVA